MGLKRLWGESLAHAKGGWTRWIDVEKIKYGFARRVRSKKRKSRISLTFKMYHSEEQHAMVGRGKSESVRDLINRLCFCFNINLTSKLSARWVVCCLRLFTNYVTSGGME